MKARFSRLSTLPGKIPFNTVASLLFMFSALGFAPAQCAITPVKPVPPVGCKDLTPQCVTNGNGQGYWTWICVPDGADAEQRELAARQAEDDQHLYDALGRSIASMKARHWVKKYCQKRPGGSWWYKNPREGIDAHGVCPSAIRADSVSYNTSHAATESSTPPVDDTARAASYERGCNGGDMQSCANLGTMYRFGWGVNKDASQALAAFQRACAGGNLDGCKNAEYYQAQVPKEQAQTGQTHITQAQAAASFQVTNPASAQTKGIDSTLLAKAQEGDANAEFQVGQAYANGEGVAQDFFNAALWYRKAAEQGNVNAQYMLGSLYARGLGVPKNFAQADKWYRKAAEQGLNSAQDSLASAYLIGNGVPQDYAQATIWYRKAAEQGDAMAQWSLGVQYDFGHGVAQDYAQAAAWYRKAADQGNSSAQIGLGLLYEQGKGVPQDYAQAAVWYRKAAEQGDTLAQWDLGSLYDDGHGVPQDYAEAYFWLNLAAAAKIEGVKLEDVAKERDEAASHLTPADLSRAQERARKWFEDHPARPQ